MRPLGQCIFQAPISMCFQELFLIANLRAVLQIGSLQHSITKGLELPSCKEHHISLTHFFLHWLDENVHCYLASGNLLWHLKHLALIHFCEVWNCNADRGQQQLHREPTFTIAHTHTIMYTYMCSIRVCTADCTALHRKVAIERILQAQANLLSDAVEKQKRKCRRLQDVCGSTGSLLDGE